MSEQAIAFFQMIVPIGLALIMFSMGLTLRLADFGLVLKSGRLVSAGLAGQLVALPLLALAIGRAIGVGRRDAMTLAIEIGVQNVTLAIFLTLTVLGSLELAVTQNIYGVVMLVNGTILIRLLRRRIAADA